MRKLALLVLLLAFIGFSAGAYDRPEYYECFEDKLCIYPGMDDNNISNDPVKNSGKAWNATMEIHNASYQKNISERIENVSFNQLNDSTTVLRFDGILQVKSECHVPDYDINYSTDQVYSMEIYGDKADDWSCTERPTRINYTMKIQTSPYLRINIEYNNLTRTLETEGFKLARGRPEDTEDEKETEQDEPEDSGPARDFSQV